MSAADLPVFTQQQIDAINRVRRQLTDLTAMLDKAEKCGVNCQQFREQQRKYLEYFDNIITHYGQRMVS